MLLLDEPTSNLDPRWQESLCAIVERVWKELGLTVLYVTHEVHLLPRSVNRVWLLAGGRLYGDGAPARIFTPSRLSAAFGVPIEVLEREGRRYLITGTGRPQRGREHA